MVYAAMCQADPAAKVGNAFPVIKRCAVVALNDNSRLQSDDVISGAHRL